MGNCCETNVYFSATRTREKKITTDRTLKCVTSILFFITAAASATSRPFELPTFGSHVRFRVRMRHTRRQTEMLNALTSVTRSLHQDCALSGRGT